ncbi:ParA family protein [bacterium]|nr:ParA family protein [bacterium]
MKHFSEARRDVQNGIFQKKSDLADAGVSRVCLIWDIKGILRVLLKIDEKNNVEKAREAVLAILQSAAGPFWKNEIWVWSEDSSKAEEAVYEQAWKHAETIDYGQPEIKILDRHISKASWFNPPLNEPWPLNEHTPPVLSFYSFKGGVGRTTALVSLAIQLARSGKKVAVIDLDLEAPGLSSLLPGADGQVAEYGVVDFLLESSILESRGSMDISDYCHVVDDQIVVADGPPITVFPAGKLDEYYLEKLARIDYEALYAPMPGERPGFLPLKELLKHIRSERDVDYILIDSRAGFHDLGGLALSGMSHLDVLFGLSNEQSWRGMELVVRFLGRDLIERDKKQLDCALVFAMAPAPGEKRKDQFERFLDRSYELLSTNYYDEEDAEEDAEDEIRHPLPSMDTTTKPHFPILIGFNPIIKDAENIRDIADLLSEGDFKNFARLLLERVGRALS